MKVKEQLLASVRQAQDALAELKGDSSLKAVTTTGISTPTAEEDITAAVIIGAPQSQPGSSSTNLRLSKQRNSNTHPRNIYAAEEPDFSRLASLDARLRPFVEIDADGRGSIDFRVATASRCMFYQGCWLQGQEQVSMNNMRASKSTCNLPDAWLARLKLDLCRELTRALLKHDYGIDWWVEEGQLIPAVTNRANYIHWLQDLLQLSKPSGARFSASCSACTVLWRNHCQLYLLCLSIDLGGPENSA